MSNPSKDPRFNDALKKMIGAPPVQNKDLKLGDKRPKKEPKKRKPWPWGRD